ncbi:hypothetical protein CDD81_4188 [Ophiocordyceps australis]|uniref:Uncharacterized protein n=1 Tax=Ophiocordyceps australis TaxID=1399860 RepID=A0A2C5Y798_9HYPO|nr:hypothetical protein CDD81_4188 [Ophiocordyceps australis]
MCAKIIIEDPEWVEEWSLNAVARATSESGTSAIVIETENDGILTNYFATNPSSAWDSIEQILVRANVAPSTPEIEAGIKQRTQARPDVLAKTISELFDDDSDEGEPLTKKPKEQEVAEIEPILTSEEPANKATEPIAPLVSGDPKELSHNAPSTRPITPESSLNKPLADTTIKEPPSDAKSSSISQHESLEEHLDTIESEVAKPPVPLKSPDLIESVNYGRPLKTPDLLDELFHKFPEAHGESSDSYAVPSTPGIDDLSELLDAYIPPKTPDIDELIRHDGSPKSMDFDDLESHFGTLETGTKSIDTIYPPSPQAPGNSKEIETLGPGINDLSGLSDTYTPPKTPDINEQMQYDGSLENMDFDDLESYFRTLEPGIKSIDTVYPPSPQAPGNSKEIETLEPGTISIDTVNLPNAQSSKDLDDDMTTLGEQLGHEWELPVIEDVVDLIEEVFNTEEPNIDILSAPSLRTLIHQYSFQSSQFNDKASAKEATKKFLEQKAIVDRASQTSPIGEEPPADDQTRPKFSDQATQTERRPSKKRKVDRDYVRRKVNRVLRPKSKSSGSTSMNTRSKMSASSDGLSSLDDKKKETITSSRQQQGAGAECCPTTRKRRAKRNACIPCPPGDVYEGVGRDAKKSSEDLSWLEEEKMRKLEGTPPPPRQEPSPLNDNEKMRKLEDTPLPPRQEPSPLNDNEKMRKLEDTPPPPRQEPSPLNDNEKMRKLEDTPPPPRQEPSSLNDNEKMRKLEDTPLPPRQEPSPLNDKEKMRKLKEIPPPPRQDPSPFAENQKIPKPNELLPPPRQETRGPVPHHDKELLSTAREISRKKFPSFLSKFGITQVKLEKYSHIPSSEFTRRYEMHLSGEAAPKRSLLSKWAGIGVLTVTTLPLYIASLVEVFQADSTYLDRRAAATSIIPILGCLDRHAANVAHHSDVKGADDLCLIGDALLISPFWLVGLFIRGLGDLYEYIAQRSIDNVIRRRNENWDDFYRELIKAGDWKADMEAAYYTDISEILFEASAQSGLLEAGTNNLAQAATANKTEKWQAYYKVEMGQEYITKVVYCTVLDRRRRYASEMPRLVTERVQKKADEFTKEFTDAFVSNANAEFERHITFRHWNLNYPLGTGEGLRKKHQRDVDFFTRRLKETTPSDFKDMAKAVEASAKNMEVLPRHTGQDPKWCEAISRGGSDLTKQIEAGPEVRVCATDRMHPPCINIIAPFNQCGTIFPCELAYALY